MPDLLIRDISANLRAELKKRAGSHNRSLSDEAKLLIQKGLSAASVEAATPRENPFDAIRRSFSDAHLTDQQQQIFDEALKENRTDQGTDFDWQK
ncbi:MAG: hypothetical protein AAFR39_10365 [Pseudomonadota bacterium]